MISLGMTWQTSKSVTASVIQLDSSVQKEQRSPQTMWELSANLTGFEQRILTNHSTAQLEGTAFSSSFNSLPHPITLILLTSLAESNLLCDHPQTSSSVIQFPS